MRRRHFIFRDPECQVGGYLASCWASWVVGGEKGRAREFTEPPTAWGRWDLDIITASRPASSQGHSGRLRKRKRLVSGYTGD